MKKQTFLASIKSALIWKGLDRVAGLFKHILIASAIGLSAQLDVFYMVVAILGVLVFSWASLLDVLAVPRMVELIGAKRDEELVALIRGMMSCVLIFSLLLTALLVSGSEWVSYIAWGFDAERARLLEESLFWLIPVIVFYIPFRFVGSVLRASRDFSGFYQAESVTAITVLACVFFFRESSHVLLWSFSFGVVVAFLYILIRARGFSLLPGPPFVTEVRSLLHLVPGLLILQGAHYIYTLSDRIFISFLPEGGVSALSYAMTLITLLPAMVGIGGSFITVMAEDKSHAVRNKKVNDTVSLAIFLSAGVTALLVMFGDALIQVMLERGLFTRSATEKVNVALLAYTGLVLPIFLMGPLDQVYQVEGRTHLMVRRSIFGMLTNIALNSLFLFGLGWGLWGIALATSISYWVMLMAGLEGVSRLNVSFQWQRHMIWGGWMGASMLLLFSLYTFSELKTLSALTRLLVGSSAIAVFMLLSGLVYRGEENTLVKNVIRRLYMGVRGGA